MYVLVVNAGSSSLKYQLFDTTSAAVLAKGICERIGLDGFLSHKTADGRKLEKELQRKEKALAEAAALLVLSKKANAIWGDSEDE